MNKFGKLSWMMDNNAVSSVNGMNTVHNTVGNENVPIFFHANNNAIRCTQYGVDNKQ